MAELRQWVELKVGFWAVFLIALSVYAFAALVLVLGRNKYGAKPLYNAFLPPLC
jgi:hypothetical protein